MTSDNWVTTALTNDTLVVELLLRLKQSSSDSLQAWLPAKPPLQVPQPLSWGQRQPRSKTTTSLRKEHEPNRCSPTTPLSWSGGGGASTSDGYDESSRPSDPSSGGRSKGAFANESATTNTNKRSRKKKTFAELKEEEGFLLKERINLKRELASIRVTLKEQMARSENLKRIKLDLHLQSGNKMHGTSDELIAELPYQHPHSVMPRHATHGNPAAFESCEVQKIVGTEERGFILPDLNMTPSEEESGSEILYGIS